MKNYVAPAKVNLNLQILSKREDGFHEMTTLMAPLALADEMSFEKVGECEGWQLCCDFPGVPLDETNLVTKVVRELEKHTGKTFHYKVTIDKKIPHGAGLAGGSSNAATALLALNELEQLGLSNDVLAEIAAAVGSDIGFFIYQSVCKCSGRGELVKPVLLENPPSKILLIKPSFGVSTPQAYKEWQNSREIEGVDYNSQPMPWGEMVNDLERPVFQKHRFLAELKMWLLDQPEVDAAMMSGSGSTVFAILNQSSKSLQQRLKDQFDPNLWLCETKLV